eukprot:GHVT01045853.1.p1 GENE.GHVT01045853.1~~GHVT01045853.1.p1  ORF type:complete len:253 (-),score=32.25 GHVT01045853.1:1904-2662(-)
MSSLSQRSGLWQRISYLFSSGDVLPATVGGGNPAAGSFRNMRKLLGSLFVALLLIFVIYRTFDRPFRFHAPAPQEQSLKASFERPVNFLRRHEFCSIQNPCSFKMIADLDEQSRIGATDAVTQFVNSLTKEGEAEKHKGQFVSLMFGGRLFRTPGSSSYAVDWDSKPEIVWGNHNEAGRGMELSELVLHRGQLLSFDDRTGIVYEHLKKGVAVPRTVLTEGDGDTAKGMKHEWATEKDGQLWVGSFGKEYTG